MLAAVVGLTAAGSGVLITPSSGAEPVTVSQATGTFLSGTILGQSLASLGTAQATNTGGADVVDSGSFDVRALGLITIPLGGGIDLPLSNIVQLGAANQYAEASPTGSSYGASGAVTNQGLIDTTGPGSQTNASLDLARLLPSSVTGTVGNLTLDVGAVAATATETAAGTQSGTYEIADLTANLTSPLVAKIGSSLVAGLQAIDLSAINALPGVSGVPNLGALVADVGTVTSGDGCLTANIVTGEVTVDLDCAVAKQLGLTLSTLRPNTDLTDLLAAEITQQLPTALTSALNRLQTSITTALNGITYTPVPGGPRIPVPSTALAPVIALVNGVISPIASGLGTDVVQPLVSGLSGVLNLTANAQSTDPNGTFSETALQVSVLGAALPIELDLANATVGPNAAQLPDPVITSLSPDHGTAAGGTIVTTTGSDFVPGATTVTIGGTTIPADQVTVSPDGTSLTFTTPAHAPGPVGVTVTTPSGTSAPVTYTYLPVPPAPMITSPTDGSTTTDTAPPITGNGADAGATVTVSEGGTVLCTATADASGNWSCTPDTPLAAGDHTITATQAVDGVDSPASSPVTFAVGPAPTATNLNPDSGPTAGGTTVTITGSGFDPGATTVTIGSTTIPADQVTVSTDGTSLTLTMPSDTAGQVDVTATTPFGTTDPLTYTYVARPTATGLSPIQGTPAGGTVVTVDGSDFVPGATTVTIGGVTIRADQVTVSPDGSSLTFTTPAHAPGPVDVTVTTAGGTSTPPLTYTYLPIPGAPTITSPAEGSTTTNTTPTITGNGADAGATVTVSEGGTVLCTATADSSGNWSCTPSTPLVNGDHTITAIQTVNGVDSPASAPVTFTVGTAPTASSLTPGAGPVTGGTVVTLSGSDFVAGQTTVTIGGVTIRADQVTVSPDGSSLTFTTPAHVAGPVDVTVSTPGGTSEPLTYTYVLPAAPTITSPADGLKTSDTTPTISGNGAAPGATVTVNEGSTVLCTATADSSGNWSCTPSAPLADGDHTITGIQTVNGVDSPASAPVTFTVGTAPTATGLSPDQGTEAGGTVVTVDGSDFARGATTVTIDGTTVPADQVTVSPDGTSLTFTTPAHAPGPVDVTATTPFGITSPQTFTFLVPPTTITLTPSTVASTPPAEAAPTIVAASGPPPAAPVVAGTQTEGLASTGVRTDYYLLLGVVLVALGAVSVAAAAALKRRC